MTGEINLNKQYRVNHRARFPAVIQPFIIDSSFAAPNMYIDWNSNPKELIISS